MSNTYSQISIHAVFAVKGRQNFIDTSWQQELYRYIAGIITYKGGKTLAVGGWKDHVHIFFGLPVSISIADFMSMVKANSSKWINERHFLPGQFEWQSGYGAFSYAKSQRDIVIRYIMNQEAHHRKQTFQEEYRKMLEDFEVDFNEEYLFAYYD